MFIATFLPRLGMPMKQHLFKLTQLLPNVYHSMIEVMMMYPRDYDLHALINPGSVEETFTGPDFFANYRIFKVEREASASFEYAEITYHESDNVPMQDILIAHIDQPMDEGNNELLMQYQVRRKSTRMPSRGGDASLTGTQSQLDCRSQMLRTLV